MLICGFEELSVQLNLNFCFVIQQLIVPFLLPIINHDEAKWVERARNWSVSSSKPPSLIPLSKKPPPNFAYYWLVPGTKAKIISFTIAVMKLL